MVLSRGWSRPNPENLRQLEVFAHMSEETLHSIAAQSLIRRFWRGQDIALRDEPMSDMIVGTTLGRVEAVIRSLNGKELFLFDVDSGHICETGLMGDHEAEALLFTAATTTAHVCVVPVRVLDEAVAGDAKAAGLLVRSQRAQIRALVEVTADRLRNPESRVRHALWRVARETKEYYVSYTHEELAARAFTDRPRTSRIIERLRQQGAIETDRKLHRIVVVDVDVLLGTEE